MSSFSPVSLMFIDVRACLVVLIIDQDAVCGPVEILELAVPHGPEEQRKTRAAPMQEPRGSDIQERSSRKVIRGARQAKRIAYDNQ